VEKAVERLARAGVEPARAEAEWIWAYAQEVERAEAVLQRRLQRIPLAYALGEWDFWEGTLA